MHILTHSFTRRIEMRIIDANCIQPVLGKAHEANHYC